MMKRMFKSGRFFTLLALITLLCGCSGVRVSQDYPDTADYSALKTYAWKSGQQEKTGDLRLDSSLRDKRIRQAIERALTQKGFRAAAAEAPDVYVSYQEKIYSRVDVDNSGGGFLFGIGSFGYHGGIGIGAGTRTSDYDESMLVIDIIDVPSGDLLWRGTGTRSYVPHTDPQKLTQSIEKAVQKILSQFPPRPNKGSQTVTE